MNYAPGMALPGRYQSRINRMLAHHEVGSLSELGDKFDITENLEDIRDFIHGRIPAHLEPPLLGRAEVRKSPLFD